jgi:hypothetical protein
MLQGRGGRARGQQECAGGGRRPSACQPTWGRAARCKPTRRAPLFPTPAPAPPLFPTPCPTREAPPAPWQEGLLSGQRLVQRKLPWGEGHLAAHLRRPCASRGRPAARPAVQPRPRGWRGERACRAAQACMPRWVGGTVPRMGTRIYFRGSPRGMVKTPAWPSCCRAACGPGSGTPVRLPTSWTTSWLARLCAWKWGAVCCWVVGSRVPRPRARVRRCSHVVRGAQSPRGSSSSNVLPSPQLPSPLPATAAAAPALACCPMATARGPRGCRRCWDACLCQRHGISLYSMPPRPSAVPCDPGRGVLLQ